MVGARGEKRRSARTAEEATTAAAASGAQGIMLSSAPPAKAGLHLHQHPIYTSGLHLLMIHRSATATAATAQLFFQTFVCLVHLLLLLCRWRQPVGRSTVLHCRTALK